MCCVVKIVSNPALKSLVGNTGGKGRRGPVFHILVILLGDMDPPIKTQREEEISMNVQFCVDMLAGPGVHNGDFSFVYYVKSVIRSLQRDLYTY